MRGHVEVAGQSDRANPSLASGLAQSAAAAAGPHCDPAAAEVEAPAVRCAIVTENPWVPANVLSASICEPVIGMPRVVAGSYDTRELGIVVQRIWME